VLASTVPNLLTYDPAYHYELALVIEDGLRRMYAEREDVFYYVTLYNENYPMPEMPEGVAEGILKGLYKVRPAAETEGRPRAQIFGSGSRLREAIRAQDILARDFGVAADVWSATSYKTLRTEALECERWNLLHPDEAPRTPWVTQQLADEEGPVVAVTDYMKIVPEQIARWVPQGLTALGTDGYGRSDTRQALRRFFEVDAETVALAVLYRLARDGKVPPTLPAEAIRRLGIDPEKPNPLFA
jgi:pyruvate dehydrogenase E1 component